MLQCHESRVLCVYEQDLMGRYASVSDVARRACGVMLALSSGQPPLADLDFGTLTGLFE